MTVNLPRPLRFALVIILATVASSIEASHHIWQYKTTSLDEWEADRGCMTRQSYDEGCERIPFVDEGYSEAWLSQRPFWVPNATTNKIGFKCDEEGDREEGRQWLVTIGDEGMAGGRSGIPRKGIDPREYGWQSENEEHMANLDAYLDAGGNPDDFRATPLSGTQLDGSWAFEDEILNGGGRFNFFKVGEQIEPSRFRTIDIMISGEKKTYRVDKIGVGSATPEKYIFGVPLGTGTPPPIIRVIIEDAKEVFSDFLNAVDDGEVNVSIENMAGKFYEIEMDNASLALAAMDDACPSSIFDWLF